VPAGLRGYNSKGKLFGPNAWRRYLGGVRIATGKGKGSGPLHQTHWRPYGARL
jgi:hypothetical protein